MTNEAFPDALPVGYRLHWHVLEHVLGQGGFGITYLARDTNLDRRVAIKEFLPTEIARRRSDASAHPRSESDTERYAWGLERFLLEARTLARFDHPNIVRVNSVFEANNTAYMVMRFEEGENLATLLMRSGTLPERELTDCLLRILDGLELVHSAGFIHRDIKPENIYVRRDGSPVLLDFGSARQSFGSAKTMTILVAPGYAPLEQYYGDAATQGPWTDIYGLGATCYRAIAGHKPLDAIARAKGVLGSAREVLPPAVEIGRGRYSERFLAAVDHSLQLSESDRPQSIADWRRELVTSTTQAQIDIALPALATQPLPGPPSAPKTNEARGEVRVRHRVPLLWSALAGAGVLAAGAAFLMLAPKPAPAPAAAPQPAAALSPTMPVAAAPPASLVASAAVSVGVATAAPLAAAPAAPLAATPVAKDVVTPEPVRIPGAKPQDKARPATGLEVAARKPAAIAPSDVSNPPRGERGAQGGAPVPSEAAASIRVEPRPVTAAPTVALALPAAATPAPLVASAPAADSTPALTAAVTPSVAVQVAAPVAAPNPPRDSPAPRSARAEQLDAAEAALQRGDHAAAAEILAPWAAAGVPRAQVMLGRAREGRGARGRSDFEAYVWYSMAVRGGEATAQVMKDRVAAKLQPAEIQQAEKVIERWKPRAEPTASASR